MSMRRPAASLAAPLVVIGLAVGACGDSAKEPAACELATLIPGLDEVVAAPRGTAVAETLALACGDGIAAPRALHDALARDIADIAAVDERMRLAPIPELQVYGFWSTLDMPPRLHAEGPALVDAREALDASTCAGRVTAALHGTAREQPPQASSPFVAITFAPRLHPGVLVHVYAALGITFTAQYGAIGDGSRAAYRDVAGGREWLFDVRGGDCPSGCTTSRRFWWRVIGGEATLLGEWGAPLGGRPGGESTPPPEGFDPAGFDCRKCADGRATRVVVERACDDGVDDDCDGQSDCDDPDCDDVGRCRDEICDNDRDDDLDGDTDCDDDACAHALACGAGAACEAPADRTFIASWAAPRGIHASLDKLAMNCQEHEAPAACVAEALVGSGVSAQCAACLGDVGACLVTTCPAIGHTESDHAQCISTQCEEPLSACLP